MIGPGLGLNDAAGTRGSGGEVMLSPEAGLLPRTVRALFAELEARVQRARDSAGEGGEGVGAEGGEENGGAVWLDSPNAVNARKTGTGAGKGAGPGFGVEVELLEVYRDGERGASGGRRIGCDAAVSDHPTPRIAQGTGIYWAAETPRARSEVFRSR